jgi:hypothetical protein
MLDEDPEKAVAAIMQNHPTLARKVADGVLSHAATRNAVTVKLAAPITPRMVGASLPVPTKDYHSDITRLAGLVTDVVSAVESGRYSPTGGEEMLLAAVAALLTEHVQTRANGGASAPNLFAQIDAYLNATATP